MSEQEQTTVELKRAWRVGPAPTGSGICLYVDRGIPAAGHTQVVSLHMTDTPTPEQLRRAVKRVNLRANKVIDAAVELLRVLPLRPSVEPFDGHDPEGSSNATCEAVALLVYHQILVEIARAVVEIER